MTVSEVAASGTNLADYNSSINCGAAGSGTGTSLTLHNVTADTSCTITNVLHQVQCNGQHRLHRRSHNPTNQQGCLNHDSYRHNSRSRRRH